MRKTCAFAIALWAILGCGEERESGIEITPCSSTGKCDVPCGAERVKTSDGKVCTCSDDDGGGITLTDCVVL